MVFDPHPDANLVGALLEGKLSGFVRRDLLRHLSACDPCRRWVACAHAASDHANVAAVPARPGWRSRGFWWEMPLAAASVAVVAGGLWLRAPRTTFDRPLIHTAPVIHRLASVPATRRPQLRSVEHRHLLVPAAFVVPAPPVLTETAPPPLLALSAMPAPPPNTEIQPSIDFSPLMTGFQDQAPLSRVSRSELAAWTTSAAPAPAPARALAPTVAVSSIATSTPVALTYSFTGESSESAAPLSGPLAPALATSLGWAISRGGQVLRSIGTDMWAAVPLVPGVHIHALSASESRIWAGGRADQLYVSLDHGNHWRQVQLPGISSNPAPIRSIIFNAPEHGLVTTTDGRSWLTTDGGDTWVATNNKQ